MDKSVSHTQQPSRPSASPQTFDGILQWLIALVQLTEKEKKDAGLYFGNQRYFSTVTITNNYPTQMIRRKYND
jgi:hypothetical protein